MSTIDPSVGRHVVRIEREEVVDIPDDPGRQLGQTYYQGLFFHEGEVAKSWAMETFERSPGGGTQKGLTINKYRDGSTTVMSFQGSKTALEQHAENGFDGTWHFVSGTGRFEGISGGGTYEGEAFSNIAYSNVTSDPND
ncbi:hypothetical protein KUV64_14720 [Mameliella alba]|uniref:hypothetical protein n=1 Tax=Mameliella alba TaxID=561184 RepID=UPI001C97C598|nr:hypothetical protein [Mameliella alba]MBY6120385.1 hypothetical protein [Mameliella alba]